MPEGDSLRRAAERVRVLEGEIVQVVTPNPRAASLGLAERLDGKRLERVEAVGKNLLLTFEGGLVLRSHLRMKGRWRVQRGRRAARRISVARAARTRGRGGAVARAGARAHPRTGPPRPAGARRARRSARPGRNRRPAPRDRIRSASSARRSSTSGSSPGSGTCGARRDSSSPGSRPGRAWATCRTTSYAASSRRRPRRCGRAGRPGRSTAGRDARALAAGRRSSRGRRATTRAWPTGVPRASRGRQAPLQAMNPTLPAAADAAPCGVLGRPCTPGTGAPCVLAWLGQRPREAGEHCPERRYGIEMIVSQREPVSVFSPPLQTSVPAPPFRRSSPALP